MQAGCPPYGHAHEDLHEQACPMMKPIEGEASDDVNSMHSGQWLGRGPAPSGALLSGGKGPHGLIACMHEFTNVPVCGIYARPPDGMMSMREREREIDMCLCTNTRRGKESERGRCARASFKGGNPRALGECGAPLSKMLGSSSAGAPLPGIS